MEYGLLVLVIISFGIQTISFREFGSKYLMGSASYFVFQGLSFLITLAVLLAFNGIPETIHPLTLWLGIIFGIVFVLMMYCFINAMETGSMALSSLIFSFALVVPVIYGLFTWNESVSWLQWTGLIVLLISFYIGNRPTKSDKKSWNIRWFLWCIIAFFLNGGILTMSKAQALAMNGEELALYLIVGFTSALLTSIILFIIFQIRSKKKLSHLLKPHFAVIIIGNGVSTAAGNLMVMYLATLLPSVIHYPIQAGGLVILTTFISMLIYKEKIPQLRKISIALGVAAIVLLSLH